jgi:hypothetical protein
MDKPRVCVGVCDLGKPGPHVPEMLAMISEKNDFVPGASGDSNICAWFLQSAFRRISATRMLPLDDAYANRWQ